MGWGCDMKRKLGGCDMKRFTWWRMEQNAPHNARERWCASCSILHHVKRSLSHSPNVSNLYSNILGFVGVALILNIPALLTTAAMLVRGM